MFFFCLEWFIETQSALFCLEAEGSSFHLGVLMVNYFSWVNRLNGYAFYFESDVHLLVEDCVLFME